jgi:hypothetical protein
MNEEKGEPNRTLYNNWRIVFHSIPGFEQCVCLHRVRRPDRIGDMDFLLINAGNEPKLGLVECEGFDKSVPSGVEQLLNYLAGFIPFQGDGKSILKESIQDAFNLEKKNNERGKGNLKIWSSEKEFMHAAGANSENDFINILDNTSFRLVPILLYYRTTPLTTKEEEVLSLAFARHRLYAGAVQWPDANKILDGRYLSEDH